MHFMAVGDGLFWTITNISIPWRSVVPDQTHDNNQGETSTNCSIQRSLIRPFGEYLSQDLSLYFYSKAWGFWGFILPTDITPIVQCFFPPLTASMIHAGQNNDKQFINSRTLEIKINNITKKTDGLWRNLSIKSSRRNADGYVGLLRRSPDFSPNNRCEITVGLKSNSLAWIGTPALKRLCENVKSLIDYSLSVSGTAPELHRHNILIIIKIGCICACFSMDNN